MAISTLAGVPPLTIGAGARERTGALARDLAGPGAAVLLVADPGLPALAADLGRVLREAGLSVETFGDFKSDPTIAQVDAAAAVARRGGARIVVALGGGSALDLGKAAAAVAGADAPATAYALCAAPLPATPLRCICVPTTAGTGAEATRTAVLSGPDGAKLWFWGDALKPDHAVLDPELTVSLPAWLTAATGLDALVHAVEAATNRRAFASNDVFALEAIRLVHRHLPRAIEAPGDLAAREGLLVAAALAGVAIDNAGTAAAHAIGHAMASLRPVHHGQAVGIAMLASLPWVVGNDPQGRFAACSTVMDGVPSGAGFIDAFATLVRRCDLATDMTAFADITPERLAAQIDRPENRPMMRATARDAGPDDILRLARAVLAFG